MKHKQSIFLKEHRKAAGERRKKKITLVEVAEHLGHDHSMLSKIENGACPWNRDILDELAHYYKIRVTDFFYLPGHAPKDPSDVEKLLAEAEALDPDAVRGMLKGFIEAKKAS